jgi:hypothetical protein
MYETIEKLQISISERISYKLEALMNFEEDIWLVGPFNKVLKNLLG